MTCERSDHWVRSAVRAWREDLRARAAGACSTYGTGCAAHRQARWPSGTRGGVIPPGSQHKMLGRYVRPAQQTRSPHHPCQQKKEPWLPPIQRRDVPARQLIRASHTPRAPVAKGAATRSQGGDVMTALMITAAIVTGLVVGWWVTLTVALAAMSRSQARMQRKVRYWQVEAGRAQAAAEQFTQPALRAVRRTGEMVTPDRDLRQVARESPPGRALAASGCARPRRPARAAHARRSAAGVCRADARRAGPHAAPEAGPTGRPPLTVVPGAASLSWVCRRAA